MNTEMNQKFTFELMQLRILVADKLKLAVVAESIRLVAAIMSIAMLVENACLFPSSQMSSEFQGVNRLLGFKAAFRCAWRYQDNRKHVLLRVRGRI